MHQSYMSAYTSIHWIFPAVLDRVCLCVSVCACVSVRVEQSYMRWLLLEAP